MTDQTRIDDHFRLFKDSTIGEIDNVLKRKIGDIVRINPYSQVTGEIIARRDQENCINFDYKVKLNIPKLSKYTIYTYNYNKEEGYWWQFFNDDELDNLERNYEMVYPDK